VERLGLAAAACITLGILGFYAGRLGMPLPIFGGDEGAYLIRALYPPEIVAANPYVAKVNNGAHLSVIRAVYEMGLPFIIGDRLVNSAAYLGGLALIWRASVARTPRAHQVALGLLALAFPYYRFAFSNMAEGLFVGVLALLCLATGRWYRSRPVVHALTAGAIAAALVLIKPNGVASIAALGAVAVLDAAVSGGWRRLPLRILLFAAAFFAVGNLIQWGAQEPTPDPLRFFVGDIYRNTLGMKPPKMAALATLGFLGVSSALAILAGAPIMIGLADLWARWRAQRRGFTAEGSDLVFLLLTLSAAATVVMVAIFAGKVGFSPEETKRLWGRYFEFFAPLLWLAAAPALARPIDPRVRWACAAVMLAGLAGLLAAFRSGVVLFPWDASAVSAFFHADAVRAPVLFGRSFRLVSSVATVAAAAAIVLRLRPVHAGLGLVLVLGVLSTRLDQLWLGALVAHNAILEHDARAIRPTLPARPTPTALLAQDANEGHLAFLRLDARPRVFLGPSGAQATPADLKGVQAVVVSGPGTPPGGPWVRTYKGEDLSVFRPAAAP